MGALITQEIEPNEEFRQSEMFNQIEPSLGASVAATAEDAWVRNPVPSLAREIRRDSKYRTQREVVGYEQRATGRPVPIFKDIAPEFKLLPPEEATENYGKDIGLKFDNPISAEEAQELRQLKKEELVRQDIAARTPYSLVGTPIRVLTGLAATAADPINLATSFVPVVGPARYASWLSRAGSGVERAAIRAGVGAAEGTVGAALVEPIVYGVAQSEQADYDFYDSFVNLAFGSVLGGATHVGGGIVGDSISAKQTAPQITEGVDLPSKLADIDPEARIEPPPLQTAAQLFSRADVETREEGLRLAVTQALSGKEIDVGIMEPNMRQDMEAQAPRIDGDQIQTNRTDVLPVDDGMVGADTGIPYNSTQDALLREPESDILDSATINQLNQTEDSTSAPASAAERIPDIENDIAFNEALIGHADRAGVIPQNERLIIEDANKSITDSDQRGLTYEAAAACLMRSAA